MASILETLSEHKITGFFNRVRLLFRFGIIKLKQIAVNKDDSVEYLKNKYYEVKIAELEHDKNNKQSFIESNNLDGLINKQKTLSLQIFKANLQKRYKNINESNFSIRDYRFHFDSFVKNIRLFTVLHTQ